MRFKRYGLSVCLICLLMSTASIRAALVPDSSWDAFVSQFLEQYFVYQPTAAVSEGRHEFDGKLPDWSEAVWLQKRWRGLCAATTGLILFFCALCALNAGL